MKSFVMDLKKISLQKETDFSISIVREEDGFFLNRKRYDDFRLRTKVYSMLIAAQSRLPKDVFFMIYESYRPFKIQEKLWKKTTEEIKKRYPDVSEDKRLLLCETFTATPYDGIGSGHMAACAIDVTLCDERGFEVDMGTSMHEISDKTPTLSPNLTDEVNRNRAILKEALEAEGFANYPAEWWHYSYGDHQWAWLVGRSEALYGMLDLPDDFS